MKTKKEIYEEIHDAWLDRLTRMEFDEILFKTAPEEEKKLEEKVEKAAKELEDLQAFQKAGRSIRLSKIKKAEVAKTAADKAFAKVRYRRLIKLAKDLIKEEK